MELAVERNNSSLYILDVSGDVLCHLPNILARDNQRTVLKTLSIFFKHFKNEVQSNAKRRITNEN